MYSVLIADDEKNCRDQLSSLLLAKPEFQIKHMAADGEEALFKLKHNSYDLVFMDIGMPVKSGIEVLQELRLKSDKHPYIIFATAFNHHGATAFELDAIDYMIKPVTESRLHTALNKFLRLKDSSQIKAESLEDKLSLQFELTAKECEICKLVFEGQIREEIRENLGCSDATLKTHLGHIYEKTGLTKAGDTGRADKFSRLLYLLFKI